MPTNFLKDLAEKTGWSIDEAEQKWKEAKKIALEKYTENDKNYWKYAVGIIKKMAGINESEIIRLNLSNLL